MSTIARVEPFVVPYIERNDHDSTRWSCLVRIESGDGVIGWGEAATIAEPAARATAAMIDAWRESLCGLPAEPDAVNRWADATTWWYGDAGVAMFARSAVDLALWDLELTATGRSLGSRLGCADRTLPALLSLHATHADLTEMADDIAHHVERVSAVGVKVAYGKRGDAGLGVDLRRDVDFVRILRERLGADAQIMIDVAATLSWSLDDAVSRIRAFEQYDVSWTEEPLGADDPDGYRALHAAVSSPIAYGEREWNARGYDRHAATGTLDVAGVDPGRVGGVTGFLDTTRVLEKRGVRGNAHAFAGPILLAAAVPLSLASPAYEQLEYPPHRNSLFDLASAPAPHSGRFRAASAPGLGVAVDEQAVRHIAKKSPQS